MLPSPTRLGQISRCGKLWALPILPGEVSVARHMQCIKIEFTSAPAFWNSLLSCWRLRSSVVGTLKGEGGRHESQGPTTRWGVLSHLDETCTVVEGLERLDLSVVRDISQI